MRFDRAPTPAIPDNVIWPGSFRAIGVELASSRAAQQAASTAWPTANIAIGFPFVLERASTCYQLGWVNGAVTLTGNIDVGIFKPDATLVVSTGSTAKSGASAIQKVDVADTILQPGLYYLFTAHSTVNNLFAWAPILPLASAMGVITIAATAIPLTTGATFTRTDTLAFVPLSFAQMRSTL